MSMRYFACCVALVLASVTSPRRKKQNLKSSMERLRKLLPPPARKCS